MKFSTNKYLFYNCYLNWCYCVVRATFNFSICKMRNANTICHSLCKPPMETPINFFRRCIPEARGTVPLLMSVMTITQCQVPEGITDRMKIPMHC